jgi:hypothetical protein
MLFDQCPALFKERYLDGVPLVETEVMAFGKAVHLGLEQHFRGGDGERAFRAAWKQFPATNSTLTGVGLTLLDKVFELQLSGEPERWFSLDTDELGAPTVGAVDLWDQVNHVVYDFKTTIGAWSQARAEREVWQPVLYTWAFVDVTDELPDFEYIVLNRATRALDRFHRKWTPDGYFEQMSLAWGRMRTIAVMVSADVLACHEQHGFCPECGGRWAHDHVCDTGTTERIRLRKERS